MSRQIRGLAVGQARRQRRERLALGLYAHPGRREAGEGDVVGRGERSEVDPPHAVGGTLRCVRYYAGSQRQPLLFSQIMRSPSPATPDIPWSLLRQYSPGS